MDNTVVNLFSYYMPDLFYLRPDSYITSVHCIFESMEDFFELHSIRPTLPLQSYFNQLLAPLSESGMVTIVVDPEHSTGSYIEHALSGSDVMTLEGRAALSHAYVIVDIPDYEIFKATCKACILHEVLNSTAH